MSNMLIEGKVAIITGGGRGIGLAIGEELAKRKVKVVLVDILDELQESAEKLVSQGKDILPLVADVRNDKEVKRVIDETIKVYGQIDILVNNAGVSKPAYLYEETIANWEKTIEVNLKGTFLFCRAVLPEMLKRKGGVIINISSKGGLEGFPRYSSYCASKFGIIGLSEALYKEVKNKGIRVNVICPGEVLTTMNLQSHPDVEDTSHWTKPDEIATLVAFLVSPLSTAVNGSIIKAYGKA